MDLHTAIKQNQIDALRLAFAEGTNADSEDLQSKYTPLMTAVSNPDTTLETMQFLIDHGADVNGIGGHSQFQQNVLFLAVPNGSVDKIRLLLDAGADINYSGPGNSDVIMDAMHGRDIAVDSQLTPLVKLLLELGAPVDGLSEYCESGLSVSSNNGCFDVVRLLDAGADAEQLSWTELMYLWTLLAIHETVQ